VTLGQSTSHLQLMSVAHHKTLNTSCTIVPADQIAALLGIKQADWLQSCRAGTAAVLVHLLSCAAAAAAHQL